MEGPRVGIRVGTAHYFTRLSFAFPPPKLRGDHLSAKDPVSALPGRFSRLVDMKKADNDESIRRKTKESPFVTAWQFMKKNVL